MEALFWVSLGLVLYVYAGYPLVLAVWARVRRRERLVDEGVLPPVSIVIAARDEAARLPGADRGSARPGLPCEQLEIIVVSDGSTDARARRSNPTPARGPAAGCGTRATRGDRTPGKGRRAQRGRDRGTAGVLVFADARQRFATDALRRLVANLADPTVGAVSGELLLDCEVASSAVQCQRRHRRLLALREVAPREGERHRFDARRHRRNLRHPAPRWQPLPAATILDDVLAPMRVVLDGRRVVFEAEGARLDVRRPTPRPIAAQDAHAGRQLPGARPRAAAPGPGTEPRVDPVRLAQARTPARALGALHVFVASAAPGPDLAVLSRGDRCRSRSLWVGVLWRPPRAQSRAADARTRRTGGKRGGARPMRKRRGHQPARWCVAGSAPRHRGSASRSTWARASACRTARARLRIRAARARPGASPLLPAVLRQPFVA